jgi:hypothetical protein
LREALIGLPAEAETAQDVRDWFRASGASTLAVNMLHTAVAQYADWLADQRKRAERAATSAT